MALTDLPLIGAVFTSKPPEQPDSVVKFIAKEGLPIWKLLRDQLNQLRRDLNLGTLQILGVLIRFGTGVPTEADPDGSVYVRLDPPTGTTWLYYRFGGAWVIFGGGGGAVNSVTAGVGLVNSGSAADPIIDAANADGSITLLANSFQVSGAIQSGAAFGATAVQPTRQVIAGAGMVGGGTLAADRTFDVVAGDATIVVDPDDIKVGVISDVNVDDTIVTEEGLAESEDLLTQLVESMEDEVAILRNIDINLAVYANALPADLEDE